MKSLFKLTDAELSVQLAEMQSEARRRTREATCAARTIIKGMEFAKRAIVVAAAGGHSMCFFGNPGTGKTLLRAFAFKLGVHESYELRPCPCGWLGSSYRACRCSTSRVQKHLSKVGITADIYIEVVQAPLQEMRSKVVTPFDYYAKQVEAVGPLPASVAKDARRRCLLTRRRSWALTTVRWNESERWQQLLPGWTGRQEVGASHACEAIGYRRPQGW